MEKNSIFNRNHDNEIVFNKKLQKVLSFEIIWKMIKKNKKKSVRACSKQMAKEKTKDDTNFRKIEILSSQ